MEEWVKEAHLEVYIEGFRQHGYGLLTDFTSMDDEEVQELCNMVNMTKAGHQKRLQLAIQKLKSSGHFGRGDLLMTSNQAGNESTPSQTGVKGTTPSQKGVKRKRQDPEPGSEEPGPCKYISLL